MGPYHPQTPTTHKTMKYAVLFSAMLLVPFTMQAQQAASAATTTDASATDPRTSAAIELKGLYTQVDAQYQQAMELARTGAVDGQALKMHITQLEAVRNELEATLGQVSAAPADNVKDALDRAKAIASRAKDLLARGKDVLK